MYVFVPDYVCDVLTDFQYEICRHVLMMMTRESIPVVENPRLESCIEKSISFSLIKVKNTNYNHVVEKVSSSTLLMDCPQFISHLPLKQYMQVLLSNSFLLILGRIHLVFYGI